MGIRLVKAAFVALIDANVTPSARTVLAYMAMTCRDDDSRPRYFGGRESTVLALGRRVPDEPDHDDPDRLLIIRERDNAFRRLQEAVTSLERAGLITRVRSASKGRTAEYQLNLSSLLQPVESTTENVAQSRTENVANARRKTSPMHDGKRRAEEREGLYEEQQGGTTSPPRAPHLDPVERAS